MPKCDFVYLMAEVDTDPRMISYSFNQNPDMGMTVDNVLERLPA